MNEERFQLLVEKHLQSLLTDEEARELAQALEASPELRRKMLDEVALSGLLARKHAEPVDLVPKVQAALRGEPDRSALVDNVLRKLPGKPVVRMRSFGWGGGLAAAAAIVLVGVIYFNRPEPEPAGTSVAVRASGEPVMAGETVETLAPVEFVYEDKTRLTLEGGAGRFVDDERVELERGRLAVQVVAHKVIATAHGEATGFGTDIDILSEPEATRISVGRGSVTFTRTDGERKIRIAGDQYVVVSAEESDALLARPSIDSEQVKSALARAVDYLKSSKTPSSGHYGPMTGHGLVALAMLHAGVEPGDPAFGKHLDAMLAEPMRRNYVVAIQAMVLEKLDPAKYRARLTECAQFLVDNQCENGQWAYGSKLTVPVGDRVVRRRYGEQKMANNSCSQIAALGIRACEDAGIEIPEDVFTRAAGWWATSQRSDKDTIFGQDRAGWCYSRDEVKPHHPYGSMTAGGIAAAILTDASLDRDWKTNKVIQAAVRWLGFHYSAHENFGPVEALMDKQFVSDTPQPATEYYYYLWALERAGTLIGTELLGAHDWYAEGVEAVLAQQRPDGSWHAGVSRCKPQWDTAYAILFLTRATRPLEAR